LVGFLNYSVGVEGPGLVVGDLDTSPEALDHFCIIPVDVETGACPPLRFLKSMTISSPPPCSASVSVLTSDPEGSLSLQKGEGHTTGQHSPKRGSIGSGCFGGGGRGRSAPWSGAWGTKGPSDPEGEGRARPPIEGRGTDGGPPHQAGRWRVRIIMADQSGGGAEEVGGG